MSEWTFAIPYTIDLRHAARLEGEKTVVTACGLRDRTIDRCIRLHVTETTCHECWRSMGWEEDCIKDYFGPGQDLPIVAPRATIEWARAHPMRQRDEEIETK